MGVPLLYRAQLLVRVQLLTAPEAARQPKPPELPSTVQSIKVHRYAPPPGGPPATVFPARVQLTSVLNAAPPPPISLVEYMGMLADVSSQGAIDQRAIVRSAAVVIRGVAGDDAVRNHRAGCAPALPPPELVSVGEGKSHHRCTGCQINTSQG